MRILIEEYQYEPGQVEEVLHGIDSLSIAKDKGSIKCVGYFYNPSLNDCVFILPKVILEPVDGVDKAFGKHDPAKIINVDKCNLLTHEEKDFIYYFSVWIYRAIAVFRNKRTDSDIVCHSEMIGLGKKKRVLNNTFLNILLQLLQFSKDNQNFFLFTIKNLHSGLNNINWKHSINHDTPILQANQPIYLRPVNKKHIINFDEELLVIYFSILYYVCKTFGFPYKAEYKYELITGKQFEVYLNGYGCKRLRQIKYKYFSDKALQLWALCFDFFNETRQIHIGAEKEDYLLAKNFNIVFEAIIDELIGDYPLPDGLNKEQEDGKIVDHLYVGKSLIENDKGLTYYLADSKYYKMGNTLGSESIHKQYTYARNIIQHNIEKIIHGKYPASEIRLRDDVTEGYNIIPNFFHCCPIKL